MEGDVIVVYQLYNQTKKTRGKSHLFEITSQIFPIPQPSTEGYQKAVEGCGSQGKPTEGNPSSGHHREKSRFNRFAPPTFEQAMKAKIIITPKKAVLDPQGKTVQSALAHMGYTEVGAVHVGKYLEVELTGADRETARKQIDDACHKILSNPVIEDYRFEIE
jgi:phosphoribosylformylglycinamidine synthase